MNSKKLIASLQKILNENGRLIFSQKLHLLLEYNI